MITKSNHYILDYIDIWGKICIVINVEPTVILYFTSHLHGVKLSIKWNPTVQFCYIHWSYTQQLYKTYHVLNVCSCIHHIVFLKTRSYVHLMICAIDSLTINSLCLKYPKQQLNILKKKTPRKSIILLVLYILVSHHIWQSHYNLTVKIEWVRNKVGYNHFRFEMCIIFFFTF